MQSKNWRGSRDYIPLIQVLEAGPFFIILSKQGLRTFLELQDTKILEKFTTLW